MCKWVTSGANRIDPCMREEIADLRRKGVKVLACCCGHGKYTKTIVIKPRSDFGKLPSYGYEMLSGRIIPRSRNFYKRDSDGIYFIPEVHLKEGK